MLARYATETAGAETISAALAANRELLASLSLLGMLTQRTRQASRLGAAASASAVPTVSAGLPRIDAGSAESAGLPRVDGGPALSAGLQQVDTILPGLASIAAMSATLAPMQRAIAQAMGVTLEGARTGAAGMLLPNAAPGIGQPSGTIGTRQTPFVGGTMPALGATATAAPASDARLGAAAEPALPPDRVVPRLPQSLAGGPGSLLAAMPFRALDAAHRQLSASQRHAAADYTRATTHAEAPGIMMGAPLPYGGALDAAQRQLAVSQRQAAAGSPGRSAAALGRAVSGEEATAGSAGQAAASNQLTASPSQGIVGSVGHTVGSPLMPSLGQAAGESVGRTRRNRRLTAAQRQAAMGLAGSTAGLTGPSGDGLGSSEAVGPAAGSAAPMRALRAFPTANRTAGNGADSYSAWSGLSPRQAALRQIAGSAGQPLAPVVRRMMEMALGAAFADVRIHTGSAAGGAAQALGAQAFTMGRDIYFAPGKFEPGAAPGLALLAHELTHTQQGAAVPLRKAAPGAPALDAGEIEPEHLEAQARGSEAAVLRAFSGPPAMPVLSRMVAGNYDALSNEVGVGSGGAWSPFAPRPTLSGGGSGAALAEGLASYAARSTGFGGASSVQRQIAGVAPLGTLPIIPTVSAGAAASQSASAAGTAGSTGIVPSTAQSAAGSPIAGSMPGMTVQRRSRRAAAQAPQGESVGGNAETLAAWSLQGGEVASGGTPIQRFTMPGTLLGDLARRRDAQRSPGAVPLSSIFTTGGEGTSTAVQRRAGGDAGRSFTFGADASGLAALAGGAAFRASASTQPAWAVGYGAGPVAQRTESSGAIGGSAGTSTGLAPSGPTSSAASGTPQAPLAGTLGSGDPGAAVSADRGTIPVLQRLAAGGLHEENTPANADDLSAPILARMNASEHGTLSFGGAVPTGESWGAPQSLSLGGQGAGWAGAAGGILHQVQRLSARQADFPGFSGTATGPFAASMGANQGSSSAMGGAPAGSSFGSPDRSLGIAGDSASPAMAAAVQRTHANTDFPGSSIVGSIQRSGIGVGSPGSSMVGAGPAGSAAGSAVQRISAHWAGAPTSVMSLSGHGYGLAAMTGGLAARTLGPGVIQRMAASGSRPYDTSYASSSGAGFSAGTGLSSSSTARAAAGAPAFSYTTMLQRFAAGESGGAALGAALLARMSGTGNAGWTSSPGRTLTTGAGGIAGVAGGLSTRIQRMAGSESSGPNAGAVPARDLGAASGSFAGGGWGAESRGAGSYGASLGLGAASPSEIGGAFSALPAVQRVDPATWTIGGSQALVGQGYGLAAMSGSLTARALQAGGSGLALSAQGTGAGSVGSASVQHAVLPTQRSGQSTIGRSGGGAALSLQRFATAAAVGQAAGGAAERLAATPVLLGGGRARGGELAGGSSTVMVSRMWSGAPVGGAMTDDPAPGAAGPNGSPVPALPEMTQRAQGTSAMLVFSGLTGDETAAPNPRTGAPTLPVSRAMAMPPSTPAPASTAGRVMVQRAAPSLAPPVTSETTLAGRSLVVPPPVQRAVSVDEMNVSGTGSSTSSGSDSGTANSGSDLPKDMETLIDTVIKRLKRQLTLDHERAGGFHTSLLR